MKLIVSIVLLMTASSLHAAEIGEATVKRLMLDRNFTGKVFVELNSSHQTPISCHTNPSWEYVLDISDEYGKSIYSMLLALHASGKPGLFRGNEECSLYSSVETLQRVEMK